MRIHVGSEVGRLRSVLLHRPGAEIARMTQYQLEHLLFDDILSAEVAAAEHDLLRNILAADGAEVLEISDLLAAALSNAPDIAKEALVWTVCEGAGVAELSDPLLGLPMGRLAAGLIEGLYWRDVGHPTTLSSLRERLSGDSRMALPPLPNLMFMRDPCFTIRDRVVMGRMATQARSRESVIVQFALRHSGRVPEESWLFHEEDNARAQVYRSIEGGDVLVPSEQFLLIGCSERTTAHSVERLAQEALFPAFPDFERVYAVMMPARRSVMHLDTILTQVDRNLFIGHAPLLLGDGIQPSLPVVAVERTRGPQRVSGSILDVLRDEIDPTVRLAPCGGSDPLHQHREQWTDGANAVCLAPGKIVLYRRNVHTIRSLCTDHGFTEVPVSTLDAPEERQRKLAAAKGPGRVVFTFTGSELSRARGGGRCLTMPLEREL
jgi:arginine deiminase